MGEGAGGYEARLAAILERFDAEEKDDLGEELARTLGLDDARDFVPQVAERLGRELSALERFRVDTLFRAQRYAGVEEEEEEEE